MVKLDFENVVADQAPAWNETCRRAASVLLSDGRPVRLESALLFWLGETVAESTGVSRQNTGKGKGKGTSKTHNGRKVHFAFDARFATEKCRLPELLMGSERPPAARFVDVQSGDSAVADVLSVAGTHGAWTIEVPGIGSIAKRNAFVFNPDQPDVTAGGSLFDDDDDDDEED